MARQFDNREKMADLFFAISYYRRRRGMSQEQLAEELGISRQHLAAIEAPNMNRGLSLELPYQAGRPSGPAGTHPVRQMAPAGVGHPVLDTGGVGLDPRRLSDGH